MTSVHYQFLAKENVGSSANLKSRAELQENFATPRRALGDVNKDLRAVQTPAAKALRAVQTPSAKALRAVQTPSAKALRAVQTPSAKAFNFGELNTEKESCKKKKTRRALASISENELKQDFKPKKTFDKQVKSSTITSKNLHVHDDIEKAHRPPQKNDDYEDIWPKKERASSYLDKLLSWKPSCFQIWQVSDGSDSDHGISDNEDLPTFSEIGDIFEKALYCNNIHSFQSPEVENITLPDIENITLPDIDITLPDIDELLLLSDEEEDKS